MILSIYLSCVVIPKATASRPTQEFKPLACPEPRCPECKPIQAICVNSDGLGDNHECDPWEECWYS